MILELLKIPVAFAMGWLDRQRGTPKLVEKIPKSVALLGLGISVAFIMSPFFGALWEAVFFVVAIMLSYNVWGWGQPLGAIVSPPGNHEYEVWQFGILKTNPTIAMAFRGFMFTLTTLALITIPWGINFVLNILFGMPVVIAYDHVKAVLPESWLIAAPAAMAFALAPHLAVREGLSGEAAWARQETIRGVLFGLALLISVSIWTLL